MASTLFSLVMHEYFLAIRFVLFMQCFTSETATIKDIQIIINHTKAAAQLYQLLGFVRTFVCEQLPRFLYEHAVAGT